MSADVTKDLLEALKIVTSQLERVGDTRRHKDGEFIDLGRAAIARAEAALAATQPDADGWIPWAGGKCPVDEDALVEIWRRDGVQLVGDEARPAIRWSWSNCNVLSDIIAYRVEGEPK